MTYTHIPAPGSDEAGEQGCLCPVLDNAHGKGSGYRNPDGSPVFWIVEGCPLHHVDAADDQKGDSNDVGDARPEWTGNADHKGDCVFCSECGVCTVGGVTSRCWVTKDGRHITGRDGT